MTMPRGQLLAGAVLAATIGAGPGLAQGPDQPDIGSRTLSQSSVFASVSQSWKGADQDIVYGHFDLGSPPAVRRYYCLIDAHSGKREPNAVLGEPIVQKDGTTALHMSSVSLYACADAQRAGYIDTGGYQLTERAARALAASPIRPSQGPSGASTTGAAPAAPAAPLSPAAPAAPAAAAALMPAPASVPTPGAAGTASSLQGGAGAIEVAGVRLGMTGDEARAALKGRGLLNYCEALGLTGASATSASDTGHPRARFLRRLQAWSAPDTAGDGESIEVLFTPIPGHEQAYAIVDTLAYAPARAIRQVALDEMLEKRYGGFSGALPPSPTWRLQRDGRVEVGDECELRGLFGGMREIGTVPVEAAAPALDTSVQELESQAQRCGIAIVTEDHVSTSGSASREARRITRVTLTAYSPAIALEGVRASARGGEVGGVHEPTRP
jgi:hypothetical protein